MELRHLRYSVALAEKLHFAHAAEYLRIAQSSLSQQIRSLEEELGVKLFERTKRKVRLTDAGRLFVDEARQILAHVERAASTMRQASRGETGRLSIGLAPWMDWTNLPDLIRRFGKRHPGVHVEVHTVGVLDQLSALRDGQIGIAFLRPPVNDRSLMLEPILREPVVVALPKNHRLAGHKHIPARALAREPFVVLQRSRAPAFYDHIMNACREAAFIPRVTHEADQPGVVLGLVSVGIGISLVPASAHNLGMRRIVFRPLRPSPPRLEVVLAWRRYETSPIVQTFLKVARGWRRANSRDRRSPT